MMPDRVTNTAFDQCFTFPQSPLNISAAAKDFLREGYSSDVAVTDLAGQWAAAG